MDKVCMTCRWSVPTDGECCCLPRDEHQHPEHWCRFWEEGIDDPRWKILRQEKMHGYKGRRHRDGTDTGKS